eukprot:TRINITY_DN12131_c0_g1_i3.p2 TRINITY_DN12131_c0_g1~~TRINITY_DN12131_c0_g1_i3.p2  ORF type:complete len:105 (-),score=17.13 TRINITY_DN12131_c0_g1_i3:454-768(-)
MSSLPTLLAQMKELRSTMANDRRRRSYDDVPGNTNGSQDTTLLAGSPFHQDPTNFPGVGQSGQQCKANGQRKFSSQPPNPASSALQFLRARQERIASRSAPFVV